MTNKNSAAERTVRELFEASIAVKRASIDALTTPIVAAANHMCRALDDGGRVLACGNGGSAADAQHFSAELVNRFECERRALAAIALTTDSSNLTAIANDYDFDRVFSRQIEALGRSNDVLLAISTSGNSRNIEQAIAEAHEIGMMVVLMTGGDGGRAAARLSATDVLLKVHSDSTARVQETHLLILHCLCKLIDERYSGGMST